MANKINVYQSVEAFYMDKESLLKDNATVYIVGVFAEAGEPFETRGKVYTWARLTDEPLTGFDIKVILIGESAYVFKDYKGERVIVKGRVEKDTKDQTPDAVKLTGCSLIGYASESKKTLTSDERKNLSIVRQVIFKSSMDKLEGITIENLGTTFDSIKEIAQKHSTETWLLGKDEE